MTKVIIQEINNCNFCPYKFGSLCLCSKTNKLLPEPEDDYIFIPEWCPLPNKG